MISDLSFPLVKAYRYKYTGILAMATDRVVNDYVPSKM